MRRDDDGNRHAPERAHGERQLGQQGAHGERVVPAQREIEAGAEGVALAGEDEGSRCSAFLVHRVRRGADVLQHVGRERVLLLAPVEQHKGEAHGSGGSVARDVLDPDHDSAPASSARASSTIRRAKTEAFSRAV